MKIDVANTAKSASANATRTPKKKFLCRLRGALAEPFQRRQERLQPRSVLSFPPDRQLLEAPIDRDRFRRHERVRGGRHDRGPEDERQKRQHHATPRS
ncbi:MAG: hypothetical protein DMF85_06910 [Acidobacteria bacterium]|nr:MAG: hypothetical protein DMF85_06910 [Acidobacteriota bacterium]